MDSLQISSSSENIQEDQAATAPRLTWEAMPEFLTTREVAVLMRCSIPTARELCHRPDFPVFKVGKNFRVSKTALAKWAERYAE